MVGGVCVLVRTDEELWWIVFKEQSFLFPFLMSHLPCHTLHINLCDKKLFHIYLGFNSHDIGKSNFLCSVLSFLKSHYLSLVQIEILYFFELHLLIQMKSTRVREDEKGFGILFFWSSYDYLKVIWNLRLKLKWFF